MARYSDEFKEQVVRKMMPPDAQSVAQVHRETGISEPTLSVFVNEVARFFHATFFSAELSR